MAIVENIKNGDIYRTHSDIIAYLLVKSLLVSNFSDYILYIYIVKMYNKIHLQ